MVSKTESSCETVLFFIWQIDVALDKDLFHQAIQKKQVLDVLKCSPLHGELCNGEPFISLKKYSQIQKQLCVTSSQT